MKWLLRDSVVGFCLTFAWGVPPAEMLTRMGAEPEPVVRRDAAQAHRMDFSAADGFGPMVRVGSIGGWGFAEESVVSREGSRDAVMRRVSAGTTMVSVLGTDCSTEVRWAEGGVLVAMLDAGRPYDMGGSAPVRLWAAMRAVGFEPEFGDDGVPYDSGGAAVRMVEETFGIPLRPSDLEVPLASARLLPVLDEPWGVTPRGGFADRPAVSAAVAGADPARLRPVLVARARVVLAAQGLDARPEVGAAVDAIAAGQTLEVDNESALGVLTRRASRDVYELTRKRQSGSGDQRLLEAGRAARGRWAALEVLRALVILPPALVAARLFSQDFPEPDWQRDVITPLT